MTTKQLEESLEGGLALKNISQAYTEIASAKLKRIRSEVERNRYFLEDLAKVYKMVRQIASTKKVLTDPKNGQTISILITSNYHFYGTVNSDLIRFFIVNMISKPTDQIIIGKTALDWIQNYAPKFRIEPYMLQSDYPTPQELNTLVTKIKNYSKILVFYSKLESVMIQNPTFVDVTQTPIIQNEPKVKNTKTFIFEPEIAKILDFFDSQVTNLLLEGAFLESELSRTASRLISMDKAQLNAENYIGTQLNLLNMAKRTRVNSKLLETFSALSALFNVNYMEE